MTIIKVGFRQYWNNFLLCFGYQKMLWPCQHLPDDKRLLLIELEPSPDTFEYGKCTETVDLTNLFDNKTYQRRWSNLLFLGTFGHFFYQRIWSNFLFLVIFGLWKIAIKEFGHISCFRGTFFYQRIWPNLLFLGTFRIQKCLETVKWQNPLKYSKNLVNSPVSRHCLLGKVGRLEGLKVGRLEGWNVGRLEGQKFGRLESSRN